MLRQLRCKLSIFWSAQWGALTGLLVLCVAAPFANGQSSAATSRTADEARQATVKSLTYLEKGGTGWLESQGCAGCHHAPIMIWTLNEARKRGFRVNQKAIETVQSHALSEYGKSSNFKPHPQDGGGENGLSFNVALLTFATGPTPERDTRTAEALNKFIAHLVATQKSDGSWGRSGRTPPVLDSQEIVTLWTAFALDVACQGRPAGDAAFKSRDRAFAWAAAHQTSEETQALAVRLLLAVRTGKPAETKAWIQRILAKQRSDGGWSQTGNRSSDAVATGMALYALGQAGVTSTNPALPRAWSFLIKMQQKDGSWQVHTRGTGHDSVISYFGTGWATLGLLSTVPPSTQVTYLNSR